MYIQLNNKYSSLINTTTEIDQKDNINNDNITKPSPIFVYGVVNLSEMVKTLFVVVEGEQYIKRRNK